MYLKSNEYLEIRKILIPDINFKVQSVSNRHNVSKFSDPLTITITDEDSYSKGYLLSKEKSVKIDK